jgi:hypothetical protein
LPSSVSSVGGQLALAGTPYDEAHPLAANVNNVITTDRADPVSGSISLRRPQCEAVKIAR